MITARAVTKAYRDGEREVRVLEALDLEVARGEFVAIVGASGSGKSTLLQLLGGLDVDYRGEIAVDGVRITGLADRHLAAFRNRHVGFVFQSFHLISNLPALDNVMLPAFFGASSPNSEDRLRAAALLERVGLGRTVDRPPTRLSGGERQRVAIARALFSSPRVLLADEPTGNLDPATGGGIIELFRSLNADGLTILTVTHEERMSDAAGRVLRLREGRLQQEAKAA